MPGNWTDKKGNRIDLNLMQKSRIVSALFLKPGIDWPKFGMEGAMKIE